MTSLPMRSRGPLKAGMGSFVFKGELELSSELKSFPLPQKAWASLLRYYLKSLGIPKASLSLLVCGDARSRALNKAWRRKDKPTDVLSFPLNEGKVRKGFAGSLGDIALNLPYARRKNGRFAGTLEGELAFLTLHGLLHLCGMHHDDPKSEAAMWRLSRRLFPPPPALLKRLAPKA